MLKTALTIIVLSGSLVFGSGPGDSLAMERESLLVLLKRTDREDYARIKVLSERLYGVEERIKKAERKNAADSQDRTGLPGEDIFMLEMKQTVLRDRIKASQALKDSLLAVLTEIHMQGTSFKQNRDNPFEGNGVQGAGQGLPAAEESPDKLDPDRVKARIVSAIDSVKAEMGALNRQVQENQALIREQLKGGKNE